MKKVLLGVVVIFILIIIVLKIQKTGRDNKADAEYEKIVKSLPKDTSKSTKNIPYVDNDAVAIKEIRKEKKVKEAINPGGSVLYVSVLDDGTRRDGYAQYLCQVLAENHSTIRKVKVVKFGSTTDPDKDNAYGVLLGSSDCN